VDLCRTRLLFATPRSWRLLTAALPIRKAPVSKPYASGRDRRTSKVTGGCHRNHLGRGLADMRLKNRTGAGGIGATPTLPAATTVV